MARRVYSYEQALRILGAGESAVLEAADSASAAALLGLGIFDLFEARATLFELADKVRRTLGAKLRGYDRLSRTERVYAACAVIAYVAVFEVLDEAWRRLDLPKRVKFDRADQKFIATELTNTGIISTDGLIPEVDSSVASMAAAELIAGFAQWDALNETQRGRLKEFLGQRFAHELEGRFQEHRVRLAADCPEFAIWLALDDNDQIRQTVRRGFEELRTLMNVMSADQTPDRWRNSLSRVHRAALNKAVTQGDATTNGLRIPTLSEAYIVHYYRDANFASPTISSDRQWETRPIRTNLEEFITAHLLSDAETPLLILGQPGSGKSVLTRFLAARLPAEDFLVVQVELRQVPAEADLLGQIEAAIRQSLNESVSWSRLVEAAAGAKPVVILDGFDELLQATGVSQSDYLVRVRRFQQQESDLGRPVSVIVTSRTAVANRAEIPLGTRAIRLEPFDSTQIDAWLDTWNQLNSTTLRERGLAPLATADVLRFPDLATQPLLLLMLALYDASANALQAVSAHLNHADLYDRLLRDFALRELAKSDTSSELDGLVDKELIDLSIVAFAMFNRRAQWVDESGLNADLTALGLRGPQPAASQRRPLTSAQLVVGRFFFIHDSQATRDGEQYSTYEFLHATFGEYLIAWLTVRLLVEAAYLESASTFAMPRPADDAMLYALLSFECLATRSPIIEFIDALVEKLSPELRATTGKVVLRWHSTALDARTDSALAAYAPRRANLPERLAAWSANLVVLATIAGGALPVGQLFPEETNPVAAWHRETKLWRAALHSDSWLAFVSTIAVARTWNDKNRTLILRLGRTPSQAPQDMSWTVDVRPGTHIGVDLVDPDSATIRSNAQASLGQDFLHHALEPLISTFPALVHRIVPLPSLRMMSGAHLLAEAVVNPGESIFADLHEFISTAIHQLGYTSQVRAFQEATFRAAHGAVISGYLSQDGYEIIRQRKSRKIPKTPPQPTSEASPPHSPSPAASSPETPATPRPAP